MNDQFVPLISLKWVEFLSMANYDLANIIPPGSVLTIKDPCTERCFDVGKLVLELVIVQARVQPQKNFIIGFHFKFPILLMVTFIKTHRISMN